jgi:hypothetical protein
MDNKPIHVLKYGPLQVSIWSDKSSEAAKFFMTASPRKIFKKGESWGTSYSFTDLECLLMSKLLWQAHSWIQNHKNGEVIMLPEVPQGEEEALEIPQ